MNTNGTVKIGRWTYPAVMDAQGGVTRNTRRDGTGEWTPAPASAFVADEATAVSDDYANLEAVFTAMYESYIWASADDLRANGITEKRALEYARHLRDIGLAHEDRAGTDSLGGAGRGAQAIFATEPNADEASLEEALAAFRATVPFDVEVTERAIRLIPPVNNTHKKPGRSTWAVGTPCPQGHILPEGGVYVMPSGRRQCRACRAGYPSAI